MALKFLHRGATDPARVILFPGSWNPPTVAHVDIALTALAHADEVIWILPRRFPHKDFDGAGFEARYEMLEKIARGEDGFSAAISDGGLYAEIAEEAREYFGPETGIELVLGRDAAERIAAWDYGTPGVFDNFIRHHRLLVAARDGEYQPAESHRDFISTLKMESSWDDVSSSEVRRRVAESRDWRALVPATVAEIVQNLYRGEPDGKAGKTSHHRSIERQP